MAFIFVPQTTSIVLTGTSPHSSPFHSSPNTSAPHSILCFKLPAIPPASPSTTELFSHIPTNRSRSRSRICVGFNSPDSGRRERHRLRTTSLFFWCLLGLRRFEGRGSVKGLVRALAVDVERKEEVGARPLGSALKYFFFIGSGGR
ncbi:hypothetical protein BJ508DRAFT_42329 [Ascobolus immersus RN42]|uniref:Uncharacterized protein n=1 Tax=Ascobolus immersus RN42 TaxID=1160509 RepID=A0A3N4IDI7_ASCIM|nr:hypothetical protein BJ508DRAFT_42329 [Ascobolus immersus RN42]